MNYKEKFLKSINKIAEKEIDKVNINQHYLEVLESQDKEIERLNKEIESWIKLINYNEIEDIPQYIEDLETDNKSLKKENKEIDKENKRLNNIINEVVKDMKEEINFNKVRYHKNQKVDIDYYNTSLDIYSNRLQRTKRK